ncbi:Hypothetical protein EAG7_02518 [Klebsiella aerogenes]|nr:Hypothetical protein EAG7_02518 [Klebsiella aerogenes]CCG30994.1 hypothetical protein [Klebsiella aerogenes EA1509E]
MLLSLNLSRMANVAMMPRSVSKGKKVLPFIAMVAGYA